jgi:hypothetical protein
MGWQIRPRIGREELSLGDFTRAFFLERSETGNKRGRVGRSIETTRRTTTTKTIIENITTLEKNKFLAIVLYA